MAVPMAGPPSGPVATPVSAAPSGPAAVPVAANKVQEVVVTGCLAGLDLGLDERQVISSLTPGGSAETCGLKVGDRIVSVDGITLDVPRGLTVKEVLQPQDRHVLGIKKPRPPPPPPPSGPAAVPVAGPASGSVAAAVPVAAAEAGPRFESMREMLDAASKRSEGMDPEEVEEKLKANGYNLRGLYAEFGDGDRDTFLRELGEMGVATIGQKAAIYRALKSGPRASDAIG